MEGARFLINGRQELMKWRIILYKHLFWTFFVNSFEAIFLTRMFKQNIFLNHRRSAKRLLPLNFIRSLALDTTARLILMRSWIGISKTSNSILGPMRAHARAKIHAPTGSLFVCWVRLGLFCFCLVGRKTAHRNDSQQKIVKTKRSFPGCWTVPTDCSLFLCKE